MHDEVWDRDQLIDHGNDFVFERNDLDLSFIGQPDKESKEGLAFQKVATVGQVLHLFGLLFLAKDTACGAINHERCAIRIACHGTSKAQSILACHRCS